MGGKDASIASRRVSDQSELATNKASRQDSYESATTTTSYASQASRASSDLSSASGGRRRGRKAQPELQISSPMAFQHALHIDEDLNWTGERIDELFKVEGVIGKGAFGKVFRARNTQTGQVIAIKEVVLKKKGSGRLKKGASEGITAIAESQSDTMSDLDDATKREISKEIDLLKKCSSPFIVQYYGSLWKPSGTLWILMEFCELGSVRDVVEVASPDTYSLREEQIATILYFTLRGLQYLHSRDPPIAHFDIKTNNLLISASGHVKLADFGLAQQLEGNLASVGGTPHWMAPELLLEGEEDRCGPKSDIWALGITAIELAEGDPPYGDVKPTEVIDYILDNSPPRLGMKYIEQLAKLEKEAADAVPSTKAAIKHKIKVTKKRMKKQQWSDRFIAFVDKCLQFHPDDRPSAEELINSSFIKAVAGKHADGGTDSDDAALSLHKLIKKWHDTRNKTKKRLRKANMNSAQIERLMAPSSCVSSSEDEGGSSSRVDFSTDDPSASTDLPIGMPMAPRTSTSTKRSFPSEDNTLKSGEEANDPHHDSDDMWATDSCDEQSTIVREFPMNDEGQTRGTRTSSSSSYVSFEASEMDKIRRTSENASPPKPSPKLDQSATATTPLLGSEKKSRACCACVIS